MRLQPVYDIAQLCAQHQISEAIVCPGSRCAPLTIAFGRHTKIKTRTISDERSAAFIALGIAQQRKKPTVLICTSGSAAYNFAPAIAEAYYQQVPLLVLTADRPSEWIGQRDGQTIAQQNIYGAHVKTFFQLPEDYTHPDSLWSFHRMVNEAILLANQLPKGPVHINVPLREPLYPAPGEEITFSNGLPFVGVTPSRKQLGNELLTDLEKILSSDKRTLIVAGQQEADAALLHELAKFGKNFRVPVVGDITSNLHSIDSILLSDTFLLRTPAADLELLKPDFLITIGKSTVSKNLKLFLRKNKASEHWHVEPGPLKIIDPFQSVTRVIGMNAFDFFSHANAGLSPMKRSGNYLDMWNQQEDRTASRITAFFEGETTSEFGWVHRILKQVPEQANIHLSNSLAVRYANWSGVEAGVGVEVFCNRGTSGIDGCTSTAVGHSLSTEKLNILITGDQAFFYDRNAFWHNYNLPNLRVIVLNNQGGAIFGVIDGPGSLPELNEYFVTDQRLTAEHLAREFNLGYQRADSEKTKDEISSLLTAFFQPSGRAKILEIRSSAEEARAVFSTFKESIKQPYET